MKEILKCITAIKIEASENMNLNISFGFQKNGKMILNFQDNSDLDQDSRYLNENAYPNRAEMNYGRYHMWLSMFTRHILPYDSDEPPPNTQ